MNIRCKSVNFFTIFFITVWREPIYRQLNSCSMCEMPVQRAQVSCITEGDLLKKEEYLNKALENLTQVFSEAGARATIEVMAKLKLSEVSDIDAQLMNQCNSVLYQRVKLLKGDAKASDFLKSIKAACG